MNSYGPITISPGIIPDVKVDDNAASVVFLNASPYTLIVNANDGAHPNKKIMPQDRDVIYVGPQFNGQLSMVAKQDLSSAPSAPAFILYIETFGPHETIPGTYPAPLPYLLNVGNSVPLSATATAVANDGNAAGTEFVEASVSGIEHVGIFNDGFMRLQKDATSADQNLLAWIDLAVGGHNWETWLKTGATHALYINDITSGKVGILLGSDGSAQLANLQVTVDASGNVIIPGVFKTTHAMGAADEDVFEVAPSDDASIDFTLRAAFAGSDLLIYDKKNATEIARFRNGAGANSGLILSGIGGRVRAWSFFTGNASGTYNHGLGATPNVVLLNASAVGSETLGWDSPTATQVHITNGAAIAWTAMALLMA